MNDDMARKLATRIIDTWPNGARAYVWRDALAAFDPDTAAETYHHLVRTCERPPSVAQFTSTYWSLRRRDHARDIPNIGGPVVTLDEYLQGLALRANDGDGDSADELATWKRWLNGEHTHENKR